MHGAPDGDVTGTSVGHFTLSLCILSNVDTNTRRREPLHVKLSQTNKLRRQNLEPRNQELLKLLRINAGINAGAHINMMHILIVIYI